MSTTEMKHVLYALQRENDALNIAVKGKQKRIEALESGTAYAALKNELAQANTKIIRLKKNAVTNELRIKKEAERSIRNFMDVNEDLQKEHDEEMHRLREENAKVLHKEREDRMTAEEKAAYWRAKYNEEVKDHNKTKTDLEEAQEENKHLRALLNQDSTTSSQPSSMDRPWQQAQRKRKEIPNNRERSGRPQGAQIEHTGHKRRQLKANMPAVRLLAPKHIEESSDWEKISDGSSRKLVGVRVFVGVQEVFAPIFRNKVTGEIYKTVFPSDMPLEINYDSSVRAMCLFLTSVCNLPLRKVNEFLLEASDGILNVSNGWIAKQTSEFAKKSKADRAALYDELRFETSYLGSDETVVRVNGKFMCVAAAAAEGHGVYYVFNEKKGHEATDKLPINGYRRPVLSDGSETFNKYGSAHQRCIIHPMRKLRGIAERRPDRTWAAEMRGVLRGITHAYHQLENKAAGFPQDLRDKIRARYDECIALGHYQYDVLDPPTKYEKDDVNLLKHLEKLRDEFLYFLDHPYVPYHNNLLETLLRSVTRKQAAKVTNRSEEAVEDYCNVLSIIQTERMQARSPFKKMHEIFARGGLTEKETRNK